VLDRDGVLNRTVPSPAEPRPDSPMRASEAEVFPWVPGVLRDLCAAGFGLVVVTNQPAWAKGKTTRENLEAAHATIIRDAQAAGGVILSSHVCLHRAEDGCRCRKPAPGLLEEAFARHPEFAPAASWMVGDRATDVLVGAAVGLATALVGEVDPADETLLAARAVRPSFRGNDLRDFARFVIK
jgi:D-glycero-D-manno-heptose 1,7-bisphosphate phosphatase